MNDAFKVTKNIELLFSEHAIEDSLEFCLHLSVDYSVSKDFRLDVLKSECFLVEVEALNNFDLLITDDRFHRVIRLMMNHLFNWRHILGTQSLHKHVYDG